MASRIRRFVGITGLLAVLATLAIPANAGLIGTGPASYCSTVATTVFKPWADTSNYMLTPGGSFEGSTTSWKLTGGAKLTYGNEPFFIHSKTDSGSLSMPAGSSATTPTMCFAAGDWHMRFISRSSTSSSSLRVAVTVNSLLGLVSILDGGTVSSNGTWKPSPKVSLLLTNVGGLLTTKAISLRFTATNGTTQIDDVYLDPWKDT